LSFPKHNDGNRSVFDVAESVTAVFTRRAVGGQRACLPCSAAGERTHKPPKRAPGNKSALRNIDAGKLKSGTEKRYSGLYNHL